jgi:hypothetical protein
LIRASITILGIFVLWASILSTDFYNLIYFNFASLFDVGNIATLSDPVVLWAIVCSLLIIFTNFLFLRFQAAKYVMLQHGFATTSCWLVCVLLISVIVNAFCYSASIRPIMLLYSSVLGFGTAAWASLEGGRLGEKKKINFSASVTAVLIILLSLITIGNSGSYHFEYHHRVRWVGPWSGPNMFGVLMGVGITLAVGQFIQRI